MFTHEIAATAGVVASSQDPINLHMQAMNCLARCKALLTANEPVYLFALKDLASAKQAIEALYALEQKLEG